MIGNAKRQKTTRRLNPDSDTQPELIRRFHVFRDTNQFLNQAVGAGHESRPGILSTILEKPSPETAKPAKGRGSFRRAGKLSDLDNPELPPTQAASQAKTLFSLTGGFVPIFGPSPGGLLQPERSSSCVDLPYLPPCPARLPDGPKTYAAWPVWSDSTTQGNPLPAHAEEGGHEAMAPRARLRPADQAQGEARRGAWGMRRCKCCTR